MRPEVKIPVTRSPSQTSKTPLSSTTGASAVCVPPQGPLDATEHAFH
jgi:hypothetical protein